VHRRAEVPITVGDLRGLPDKETQISKWLDAELHRRFEWRQAPLFRFHVHLRSDDEFQLTMSDACLDGWSVGTLLTELLANYFARLDQKAPPEVPVTALRLRRLHRARERGRSQVRNRKSFGTMSSPVLLSSRS